MNASPPSKDELCHIAVPNRGLYLPPGKESPRFSSTSSSPCLYSGCVSASNSVRSSSCSASSWTWQHKQYRSGYTRQRCLYAQSERISLVRNRLTLRRHWPLVMAQNDWLIDFSINVFRVSFETVDFFQRKSRCFRLFVKCWMFILN